MSAPDKVIGAPNRTMGATDKERQTAMTDIKPLDPSPGPPVAFVRVGKRWFIGNRPARVASEIVEDDGRVTVFEIGAHGEDIDATVVREKAA